jgi:FkbM family methyltransferase
VARISWRWRLAGRLRALPEFRGRDRLTAALLGHGLPPDGTHRCVIGPGLVFDARFRDDGSWVDVFFLQYEEPALVPILKAFLRPGGTFVDVGANIGVYTGWAARLVGRDGRVHAFEPAPVTRHALCRMVDANRLDNVRVVPVAVGASAGCITLYLVQGASGLTSAVPPSIDGGTTRVEVPMTTLDAYAEKARTGTVSLVKIDVEGYEIEVLKGATALLGSDSGPAVVFETQANHLERAGVRFGDLPAWLEDQLGYGLFALLPSGLRRVPRGTSVPPSTNALAVHPKRHAWALERLGRRRFRRNQSC